MPPSASATPPKSLSASRASSFTATPSATAASSPLASTSGTLSPVASPSRAPSAQQCSYVAPSASADALAEGRARFFDQCLGRAVTPECRPEPGQIGGTPGGPPLVSRADWRRHMTNVLEGTARMRNINWHAGFQWSGPWIENHWIARWNEAVNAADLATLEQAFYPVVPLFVQWTDGQYGLADVQDDQRSRAWHLFKDGKLLRPDIIYVTVTQHDVGGPSIHLLCKHYKNVMVFSSGGWGSVILPLIKGEFNVRNDPEPRPRRTFMSFIGAVHRSRVHMVAAIENSTLPASLRLIGSGEWQRDASESGIALAPRGYGRSSFRSMELAQSGSVIAHISDDVVWAPYQNYESAVLPPPGNPEPPRPLRSWVGDPGDPAACAPPISGGVVNATEGPRWGNGGRPGSADGAAGALWGPSGVGFALTYDRIPAFICIACDFFVEGSAARYANVGALRLRRGGLADIPTDECPCTRQAWESLARRLRQDWADTNSSMHFPESSLIVAMEARVRAAHSMWIYTGVIDRVADFIVNPWRAELVCVAKPARFGHGEEDEQLSKGNLF